MLFFLFCMFAFIYNKWHVVLFVERLQLSGRVESWINLVLDKSLFLLPALKVTNYNEQ